MLFKTNSTESLKISAFLKHLSARFLITIAYQMQTVTISWWIYQKTQNPLYLGLLGLAEAIPALSISLFAGHWADRMSRKKIILNAIIAITLLNGLVTFTALKENNLSELVLPILFSVIFFTGLARGIMGPSNFAFISQLVEKDLLANAATWNSFSWQLSMVLGPVMATSLLAISNIVFVEWAILFFSVASVFIYWNVRQRFDAIVEKDDEDIFTSLTKGVKYVYNHSLLLGALSLDMLAVLFGGVVAILPAYTTEIIKGGPEILGYLRAAPAIGSILMMLFLAGNPLVKNTGKLLFLSVAFFGIATIAFGLTNQLGLALFFLFFTGVFDGISVIIRATILQLYTPDEMRGRVSAVNTLFIGSSNEIGAFESGVAARLIGIIPSIIFGGSITLLVVTGFSLKFKELFRLALINRKSV